MHLHLRTTATHTAKQCNKPQHTAQHSSTRGSRRTCTLCIMGHLPVSCLTHMTVRYAVLLYVTFHLCHDSSIHDMPQHVPARVRARTLCTENWVSA